MLQAYPAIKTDPRGKKTERSQGQHRATEAASNTCFSGQRHVVSGATVWQTPLDPRLPATLALTGDGNVFVAAAAAAFLVAALWNRAGNFVRIDPTIGGGGSKFA